MGNQLPCSPWFAARGFGGKWLLYKNQSSKRPKPPGHGMCVSTNPSSVLVIANPELVFVAEAQGF